MLATSPPWVLLIMLPLVVGVAVAAHLAAKARREQLQQLAASLGWRFVPGNDYSDDPCYRTFAVFQRGDSRRAYNTLRGELGGGEKLQAVAGDFGYVTGSGKNRHTHRFSYLLVQLPFPTLALQLRPEGVLDKVAAAIGFDDIDFESAEFSRRYFVKAEDKRFAYALLDPRMMQFLLAEPPRSLELEYGRLCVAEGDRCWSAEQFGRQMQFVRRFLEHWPAHLRKEMENLHG